MNLWMGNRGGLEGGWVGGWVGGWGGEIPGTSATMRNAQEVSGDRCRPQGTTQGGGVPAASAQRKSDAHEGESHRTFSGDAALGMCVCECV